MSEVNDISRRRVADFFAARLKARCVENNETQQTRQDIQTGHVATAGGKKGGLTRITNLRDADS